jgi:methyl-accepting chemotaxis protein
MIPRMEWLGVDRSRLGTALLLFGVVGVVLAAVIAAGLVGGAISARNLSDRLQSEQAQLVEMLGRLNDSVDHLATSTDNAGQTLRTTQAVVEAVGGVASGLGSTASRLGSALDVSILGQRPFAGAAESLGSVSTQLDTLGTQVTALATNVETNADDMSQVALRVREMSQDLNTITDRIEAFDRTGEVVSLIVGGILLGGLLVAWIAIAAAFCAWVGWRLRHIGREDRPPSD